MFCDNGYERYKFDPSKGGCNPYPCGNYPCVPCKDPNKCNSDNKF